MGGDICDKGFKGNNGLTRPIFLHYSRLKDVVDNAHKCLPALIRVGVRTLDALPEGSKGNEGRLGLAGERVELCIT